MPRDFLINALDIGSDKIRGMSVARKQDGQTMEVISFHSFPSMGLRKGMVIDAEKTTEKILALKRMMEGDCKRKINKIFLNIGGYHLFCKNGRGAVAISRADQKVSQEDIDRVVEDSRAVSLPFNKEVLEAYPREFIIDGEGGIKNPLGLRGIKLEAEVLNICAFSPYVKNLIDAATSADLEIMEVLPSPLAAAEAVLTPQQKELGVVIVDIGAGSTGIAVFEEESLLHLAVLPMGSSHISNDIAIALKTEIETAEKIKLKFGEYIFKKSSKKEKIEISPGEYFVFPVSKMAQAGRARITELLDLIQKELKKISKANVLPAGVVLTGGGAKLPGLVDFSKKTLDLPAKIGMPKGFIGIRSEPSFATICGLIIKGAKEESVDLPQTGFMKFFKRIFKTFLP